MSMTRCHIRACTPVKVPCGVCGVTAHHGSFDETLRRHLCADCLPHAISAEALLAARDFSHPPEAIVYLNP